MSECGSHVRHTFQHAPSDVTLALAPAAAAVLPHKFAGLSKLTGLTELVCYGKPLFEGLLQELPLFRSLRRLSFTLTAAGPAVLEGLDLSFVQELDLGWVWDCGMGVGLDLGWVLGCSVVRLARTQPGELRGAWQQRLLAAVRCITTI